MSLFARSRWLQVVEHCESWTPPESVRRVVIFEPEKADVTVMLEGCCGSLMFRMPAKPRHVIHEILDENLIALAKAITQKHAEKEHRASNQADGIDLGPIVFKAGGDGASG